MTTSRDKFFYTRTLCCLLKGLEGLKSEIELKNESHVKGIVEFVSSAMNVTMRDCELIVAGRTKKLQRMLIQGRNIRMVIIPDDVDIRDTMQGVINNYNCPAKGRLEYRMDRKKGRGRGKYTKGVASTRGHGGRGMMRGRGMFDRGRGQTGHGRGSSYRPTEQPAEEFDRQSFAYKEQRGRGRGSLAASFGSSDTGTRADGVSMLRPEYMMVKSTSVLQKTTQAGNMSHFLSPSESLNEKPSSASSSSSSRPTSRLQQAESIHSCSGRSAHSQKFQDVQSSDVNVSNRLTMQADEKSNSKDSRDHRMSHGESTDRPCDRGTHLHSQKFRDVERSPVSSSAKNKNRNSLDSGDLRHKLSGRPNRMKSSEGLNTRDRHAEENTICASSSSGPRHAHVSRKDRSKYHPERSDSVHSRRSQVSVSDHTKEKRRDEKSHHHSRRSEEHHDLQRKRHHKHARSPSSRHSSRR